MAYYNGAIYLSFSVAYPWSIHSNRNRTKIFEQYNLFKTLTYDAAVRNIEKKRREENTYLYKLAVGVYIIVVFPWTTLDIIFASKMKIKEKWNNNTHKNERVFWFHFKSIHRLKIRSFSTFHHHHHPSIWLVRLEWKRLYVSTREQPLRFFFLKY